jgi:hypothetical protein
MVSNISKATTSEELNETAIKEILNETTFKELTKLKSAELSKIKLEEPTEIKMYSQYNSNKNYTVKHEYNSIPSKYPKKQYGKSATNIYLYDHPSESKEISKIKKSICKKSPDFSVATILNDITEFVDDKTIIKLGEMLDQFAGDVYLTPITLALKDVIIFEKNNKRKNKRIINKCIEVFESETARGLISKVSKKSIYNILWKTNYELNNRSHDTYLATIHDINGVNESDKYFEIYDKFQESVKDLELLDLSGSYFNETKLEKETSARYNYNPLKVPILEFNPKDNVDENITAHRSGKLLTKYFKNDEMVGAHDPASSLMRDRAKLITQVITYFAISDDDQVIKNGIDTLERCVNSTSAQSDEKIKMLLPITEGFKSTGSDYDRRARNIFGKKDLLEIIDSYEELSATDILLKNITLIDKEQMDSDVLDLLSKYKKVEGHNILSDALLLKYDTITNVRKLEDMIYTFSADNIFDSLTDRHNKKVNENSAEEFTTSFFILDTITSKYTDNKETPNLTTLEQVSTRLNNYHGDKLTEFSEYITELNDAHRDFELTLEAMDVFDKYYDMGKINEISDVLTSYKFLFFESITELLTDQAYSAIMNGMNISNIMSGTYSAITNKIKDPDLNKNINYADLENIATAYTFILNLHRNKSKEARRVLTDGFYRIMNEKLNQGESTAEKITILKRWGIEVYSRLKKHSNELRYVNANR